ncbi:unnamed protein product [Adineta steineri]|uniref:G-protein coupled receptors family 1 profile domain-containing protein n=1 Tax=Adineta steineri TaxID=433720 RepID=A0A813S4C5_9BILA|nr:unnamed protein product [Adineta steineri]CAF0824876.1 unnamed protein product [Adineta steineri]CAF1039897.1 unnamed protein product [Adineta steineri]
MNWTNYTNNPYDISLFSSPIEGPNPCPNQRAISRPLLFVHNYSLFVFGSVLNILAFIILMQGSLRCHSTFAYLAFLSLSNGLLSLVRFIQWMFAYYLNIQLENYLYTCRFYHFTLDFLTHFSLFTLVCVNIDRARTVTKNRPNTKFSKSTFSMVLIKECIIATILSAYHFHWLVKFGHEVFDGKVTRTICNYDQNRTSPAYFYFLTTIYPPFELIIFFCLPLLINMICTFFIVRSLRLRMRTAKRFNPLNRMIINSRQNQFLKRIQQIFSCLLPRTTVKSNIYSCFCFQIQCRRHTQLRLKIGRTKRSLLKYEEENDSIDRQQLSTITNDLLPDIQQITSITATILNKTHRSRRIRDIHLSAMLIVLNILYLIFNLPFNFHQTFRKFIYKNNQDTCIVRFTSLLLDTLQQTYFSTNFFLYVLTNRRFREEFYNTIMKLCTRKQQYRLKKTIQQKQARSFSLIPSTAIISNFNGDYQTTSVLLQPNRDSLISDIELIESSQQQQQSILTQDENNQFISKLVILEDLTNEHE